MARKAAPSTSMASRPDLSTFGKALGNGFAIAALVGRREIMERGGLRQTAERVFLLSTTHGAETHALAVAREVMRIYVRRGLPAAGRARRAPGRRGSSRGYRCRG